MVDDMLDPSVRKVNMILSLNITSCVTISFLTEVCVILVIMDSILEVERIRTVVISSPMTTSMTPSMTTSMTTPMTTSMTTLRYITFTLPIISRTCPPSTSQPASPLPAPPQPTPVAVLKDSILPHVVVHPGHGPMMT